MFKGDYTGNMYYPIYNSKAEAMVNYKKHKGFGMTLVEVEIYEKANKKVAQSDGSRFGSTKKKSKTLKHKQKKLKK